MTSAFVARIAIIHKQVFAAQPLSGYRYKPREITIHCIGPMRSARVLRRKQAPRDWRSRARMDAGTLAEFGVSRIDQAARQGSPRALVDCPGLPLLPRYRARVERVL